MKAAAGRHRVASIAAARHRRSPSRILLADPIYGTVVLRFVLGWLFVHKATIVSGSSAGGWPHFSPPPPTRTSHEAGAGGRADTFSVQAEFFIYLVTDGSGEPERTDLDGAQPGIRSFADPCNGFQPG